MPSNENTTVLITGASRGLGLELVRQYSAAGWQVIACCRHPERATVLCQLAAQASGAVHVMPLDVSNVESIHRLAQSLSGLAIDVLINNAGIYGSEDQSDMTSLATHAAQWHEVFAVNTMAPVFLSSALLSNLRLGHKKTIALMSSKMGSMADNHSGGDYIYRSSKAALNAVGKSLALDLAEQHIKLVLLHPGWVQTDMGGPRALITPEQSVTGIRTLLDNLTPENSGCFFQYDGSELPW